MQFVSVGDLRGKSSTVWEKLKTEHVMVITWQANCGIAGGVRD